MPLPLSLSEQQQKTTYFCYLFFYTIYDASVGALMIFFTLSLTFYAGLQYRRTKAINMLSKNVRLIYMTIFAWSIAYLLKLVFGEIIYINQKIHQDDDPRPGPDQYQKYSNVSKYLFGVDLVGVFILQAILILVIYNWMSNIVAIFSQISQMEDTTETKQQKTQNFLKFETVTQKLLKLYLIARFLFFGLILAFLVLTTADIEIIFTDIMLILLLTEAYVVVAILVMGLVSLRRNRKLAELVNEDQIKIMTFKYFVLFICAATRAVVDSVFVSKNFNHLAQKDHCYIDDPNPGLNLANVIFQGLFTHCLPVLFVIRIYRVDSSNVDLTQSLLAAEQYTGSSQNIDTKK